MTHRGLGQLILTFHVTVHPQKTRKIAAGSRYHGVQRSPFVATGIEDSLFPDGKPLIFWLRNVLSFESPVHEFQRGGGGILSTLGCSSGEIDAVLMSSVVSRMLRQ